MNEEHERINRDISMLLFSDRDGNFEVQDYAGNLELAMNVVDAMQGVEREYYFEAQRTVASGSKQWYVWFGANLNHDPYLPMAICRTALDALHDDVENVEQHKVFMATWQYVQEKVYQTAISHGWWDSERSQAEIIALMHSELSEALEALRKPGRNYSKKIPEFLEVEEELADLVIRLMDWAASEEYDIPAAIVAKTEYNESRPYKHGKEF